MELKDFNALFPNSSEVLQSLEKSIEMNLLSGKYRGSLKILDSFIYLFSDDVTNTIKRDVVVSHLILYSESFKRIRSSSILALKGYYIDGNSLLRSVFELGKAINSIQKGKITFQNYLSEERDESFKTLSDKEKHKLVNDHIRDVDNIINNYDDEGVPERIKDSLRIFKSNFHISVHKSLGNIALNIHDYVENKKGDLFRPTSNIEIFELYMNNASFLILIFLKNMLESDMIIDSKKDIITNFINFIQDSYSSMETKYHKDIIEYIKLKY